MDDKLLFNIKKEQKVISIFSDQSEPEVCLVGFIECYNKEEIILRHITNTGLYDGFVYRKRANIYRIDFDGKYEKKIYCLYNKQHQNHDELTYTNNNKNEIIKDLVLESIKHKWIAVLCVDDTKSQENIVGIITNLSNKELTIQRIDDYGQLDGISVVNISDIYEMDVDPFKFRCIKMLI